MAKKILWSSESSFLKTGYSTYTRNILSRLYSTGKYEIAEHGAYGHPGDERSHSLPWRFYGNLPSTEAEAQTYNRHSPDQFNKWSHEACCLSFKPQIVCGITDTWMWEHLASSPFRPYYNLSVMSACDAKPQNREWLYQFQEVDGLFTYTEWAKDEITKQSNGVVKPLDFMPAGADFNTFKPAPNKGQHKQMFGFSPDIFIVGMLSRNQKRKMFPHLFEAFRLFLDKNADSVIGRKTFLYLHTSWRDLGWDIPNLLNKYGLSHKVMFTYFCPKCGMVFPSFFQDTKGICPRCGDKQCQMPNTQFGLNDDALAAIYNLFDVYVQYANSEGQGIGQVEAAACGVPIAAVDYSGMADIVHKLKGHPIRVLEYLTESETGCLRAIPDNEHLVEILIKFLSLPETIRLRKGYETRQLCIQFYNYDTAAKKWMDYFDSVEVEDRWGSPPNLHNPITTVPQGLSEEEVVKWAIINVLGLPNRLHSYFHMRILRDLNAGKQQEGFGGFYAGDMSILSHSQVPRDYSLNDMLNQLYGIRMNINQWEKRRCGLEPYTPPMCISRYKPGQNEQ